MLTVTWLVSVHCGLALPRAPSRLVAEELTSTSVKLVWSATDTNTASSGASSSASPSFVVQYFEKSTGGGGDTEPRRDGDVQEVTDIAGTEYTVTGLRPHTRYEFRVIAANVLGRGTPSNPLQVTTAEHGQYSSTLVSFFLRSSISIYTLYYCSVSVCARSSFFLYVISAINLCKLRLSTSDKRTR